MRRIKMSLRLMFVLITLACVALVFGLAYDRKQTQGFAMTGAYYPAAEHESITTVANDLLVSLGLADVTSFEADFADKLQGENLVRAWEAMSERKVFVGRTPGNRPFHIAYGYVACREPKLRKFVILLDYKFTAQSWDKTVHGDQEFAHATAGHLDGAIHVALSNYPKIDPPEEEVWLPGLSY
jgi:hypothetical protein